MKSLSLNGSWTLYCAPEHGGQKEKYVPEMLNSWKSVPAQVPGNVELDLVRANVEEYPLYGLNAYDYAKYEYYQWIYVREICIPNDFAQKRLVLRFEGVDTLADVYLDDQFVGSTDNMLIEHEMDISNVVRVGKTQKLCVHIHSIMNYARSMEYPMVMRGTGHRNEICYLRKAPHCFGWDIMPRLVSAGIWRDVSIVEQKSTRILETYYATPKLDFNKIYLQYGYRFTTDADTLEGFSVRVRGECEDSCFEHELPAHFVSANHCVEISSPKLWWPVGYGEQPLYTVTMLLLHNGEIVDQRVERIGLRTLRLERSFEKENQQFKFFVNDTPIFVRGTNWVPLDAMHSRDDSRLSQAFDLCVESGVNMIRCWGGNVYPSSAFYDLCDQHGILVWQDFSMGNTNYPQTDDFTPALEREMGAVVKRLRNHTCLAVWSSDNEIDAKNMTFMYPHADSRRNRVAQETLRRLVQSHDPYRFYLCSSPEIPSGFELDNVPEQHTWGPRAWYKDDYYKHCSAHFIGEAGYHGCPAPSSIRKFIPAEYVWPCHNDYWAAHSTEDIRIEPVKNSRNQLMMNQVKLMFGEIPDDLERFAVLSQFVQAEADKFFVERSRALKWDRTGIIWWNMLDGWPQISDSVVDYYFKKKIAFHFLKRSQQPVLAMITETEGWEMQVVVTNDTRQQVKLERLTVEDADTGELLLDTAIQVEPGQLVKVESLFSTVSMQRLLVLRWWIDGKEHANHYLAGLPPYNQEKVLRWLETIRKLPEAFAFEA